MALDLCRGHKLGDVGIPWMGYLGVNKIIKVPIGGSIGFLGCIKFLNLWLWRLSGLPFRMLGPCALLRPAGRDVRPAASVRLSGARVIIAVELPSLDGCLP
jgi:hypothetical protein